ncbi:MBL fold metallo-hydrolase [Rhodococcus sp. IEGM 1318]|nr:MBL fold metallo-hydrolase [Rhodococcus sp. IEGM 1318]MDV8009195.1 MBL fold metallo-hydrolase [Rhodococcus sp. IEGM 1318]
MFTHSHGGHFGGVKGFVTDEEIESGAVKVYAPDSFTEEAISENVLAGTAMTRRGMYMYMYMYRSFLQPDNGTLRPTDVAPVRRCSVEVSGNPPAMGNTWCYGRSVLCRIRALFHRRTRRREQQNCSTPIESRAPRVSLACSSGPKSDTGERSTPWPRQSMRTTW